MARRSASSAEIIALPRRGSASSDAGTSARRQRPPWDVDGWGRDRQVADVASRLIGWRWSIETGGIDRLPADGPAVVVVNSSTLMLTPWFTALALDGVVERPVRFVGRPDTAPVGAIARRLGGLLDHPDDVDGALADGDLLVIGTAPTFAQSAVGELDPALLEPVLRRRAVTFPAAVSVARFGRSARIELGAPVAQPRRRGPLGAHEFADRLDVALAALIETSGTSAPGSLLDWLPLGWGDR